MGKNNYNKKIIMLINVNKMSYQINIFRVNKKKKVLKSNNNIFNYYFAENIFFFFFKVESFEN